MMSATMRTTLLLALALAASLTTRALADQRATYHGPLSTSEKAFVNALSSDLMARFPTAADAEKAGYIRYTAEDDTGAISYANLHWQSADIRHPSQLWYDKNGLLLGADYSVLLSTSPSRPRLWGVNPGRWVEFDGHQHWVTKDPATAKITYDQWEPDKDFSAAGGDPEHPTAAMLVAMKKVAAADQVVTIFHFPSLWDLIVWVKPNPNGAFAWKNPLVKP
jgi:hypothetical protein